MTCNRPKKLEIIQLNKESLNPIQEKELLMHIESCSVCGEYAAQLQREAKHFLEKHSFATFKQTQRALSSPELQVRLAREKGKKTFSVRPSSSPGLFSWLLSPGFAGLALATLALMVYIPLRLKQPTVSNKTSITYKGSLQDIPKSTSASPSYKIEIRTAQGKALLLTPDSPIETLSAGDSLFFSLYSPTLSWLTLASIDGEGKVSVYGPSEDKSLVSHKVTQTPHFTPGRSLVLDNAPLYEIFFVLYSQVPLEEKLVHNALKTLSTQSNLLDSGALHERNNFLTEHSGNIKFAQSIFFIKQEL